MLSATAAAVLGSWLALVAAPLSAVHGAQVAAPRSLANAPSLPPGVAPLSEAATDRPPASLQDVLANLGPAQLAPRPRGATPAAGSATESEALRRYVRAQLRRQEGQPRRAAEDLDAALRLDPASVSLHRARADAAAEAGDLARAVSEWEAVLALAPQDREAALAVSMAALETGQAQRAAAILGPVWLARDEPGAQLNASGQFALGATLARALLQLNQDEAAIGPAQGALAVDPARIAAERGDGLDTAVRAGASLARDAGEAALRSGHWSLAAELLGRAAEGVPEPRAQALAAVAADRAKQPDRLHALLDQLLAQGEPASETQALIAEWILHALGGDAAVAARLAVFMEQAPGNGKVARLVAAADPARAPAILDGAMILGAVDRATLRAAFEAHQLPAAVSLALRTVRVDPALLRPVARELARTARTVRELHATLDRVEESPEREAIRAAISAFQRDPGAAWRVADQARERWPDEPAVYFALVDAAAVSADPSLVQRAIVDAPDLLASDANWHAAIARAALATGLGALASASLARCDSLDPASDSASQLRSLQAGSAPSWSPRGRAEQAIARNDLHDAAAALMEARALDPDDDTALGMLLRVLPRTIGPAGTLAWTEAEVARAPNDPIVWEAHALQSVATNRAPAALGRLESHLAVDPESTAPLPAREALLRATGQAEAALVSARARAAALPAGPRRALECASVEAQAGDADAALDALRAFAEGAFQPLPGMRAAALDVLRRLPASADRAVLMRRIARDAILADDAAPLEFFAYEALSAASDPAFEPATRAEFARMIGEEAAATAAHRRPEAVEGWRAAGDFLASQGYPAAAAEFVRARLDDPSELGEADLALLARAAFAADALAGEGRRAVDALHLLGRLRAAGLEPLGRTANFAAAPYTELAAIFTLVGDAIGSERVLEAALAIDPDDPVAQNNLAYARAQRGALDARTLELARKAVAARPEDPSHLDTLGWVLYLTGRIADAPAEQGATTLLRRAVARAGRGGSGELYLHLGDALWRSNDRSAAEKAWKASLSRAQAMDRDQSLEIYREALRRQTGLGAVDAARYYDEHDASVAARARARLDAVAAGTEPPIAPMQAAPAPATAPESPK